MRKFFKAAAAIMVSAAMIFAAVPVMADTQTATGIKDSTGAAAESVTVDTPGDYTGSLTSGYSGSSLIIPIKTPKAGIMAAAFDSPYVSAEFFTSADCSSSSAIQQALAGGTLVMNDAAGKSRYIYAAFVDKGAKYYMKLTLKDPDGKLQYGTKTDFAFSAFLAKTYKEITSGETVTGGMKPMSVDNSYYKFAAETPGYLKVTLSYTIGSLSLPADNDIILSLADAGRVEPAMNRQTLTIESGKTATAYYALNKGSCYAEVRSSIPLFTLKTEFKADTVAGGSVKSTAAAVTPGKINRVSLGMKGYEDASLWYKFSLKEDASVSSVIKTIHGNSDYEVRYYNSKGHRIKSLTDKGRKLDEGTYYVRITKTSEECNAVITMKIGK